MMGDDLLKNWVSLSFEIIIYQDYCIADDSMNIVSSVSNAFVESCGRTTRYHIRRIVCCC